MPEPLALSASYGKAAARVATAMRAAARAKVPTKLWRREPLLWATDPTVQERIRNRLGWLDVAERMRDRLGDLKAFAAEAAEADHLVLLGMGGSSLAPEVMARTFGPGPGAPALVVLDSTDPGQILDVERAIDLGRTLFVVASKSGETIETLSHFRYFHAKVGDGSRFVAITDPGSPLEALAREQGFRRVFLNPPDVGGRYSALSFFGLAPAAAAGVDVASLLQRAGEAAAACGPDADRSPGLELGVALGELARRGRDKATLVLAPEIASFGAWAEQLIAESTGKEGAGIVPVEGEPLGAPRAYGRDRAFVALGAGDPGLDALADAGHPVIRLGLRDRLDLGAQFFLWELATAVAGWRLSVNPFDEPNVASSKQNTARLITHHLREGSLPFEAPALAGDGIAAYGPVEGSTLVELLRSFLGGARRGDYVALQAYLPRRPETEAALARARERIRDRRRVATTVGFGPRFLHSTGQLHKGGPSSGVFVQITATPDADVEIPGAGYSFGVLEAAQAAGDFRALLEGGRRVIRLHLTGGPDTLDVLIEALRKAV